MEIKKGRAAPLALPSVTEGPICCPSADICIWQKEHFREINLWLKLTHTLFDFMVNSLCLDITKILVKVEN